ncbi:MAG: TRZ/ATZ family hydrolase [Gammaproteobacteria bacterium]|nr:TRZ/ATZ family hydrolase [Gammaproteobacteria bacterium]
MNSGTRRQRADLLIRAPWILPVEPAETLLLDHALAVRHGRISAILPATECDHRIDATETIDLPEHVLIPGLVNSHTHAAMSLFRGFADERPLQQWLEQHIWPAESRWVGADFVHDGTQLAVAEMIRGGTTCFADMYFYPDETARVAMQAGIRCALGLVVADFPSSWAADATEYLHKGLEVHDQHRHNPLVHTLFAPHAPYTLGDENWRKILIYAEELDLQIQTHLHETGAEIQRSLDQYGQRPMARLDQLELLGPRLITTHMTQLLPEEIERLAEAGCHVVHCPESNQKLGSGIAPMAELTRAGINLALGTDGAASNNDLSMLGEMRSAALLAKVSSGNATDLPARQVLEMATLGGARALGLERQIGSLQKGKAADITAVSLAGLHNQPVYDPLSQLVYSATASDVTHVWVQGEALLSEGGLLTLSEADIHRSSQNWGRKIAGGVS